MYSKVKRWQRISSIGKLLPYIGTPCIEIEYEIFLCHMDQEGAQLRIIFLSSIIPRNSMSAK